MPLIAKVRIVKATVITMVHCVSDTLTSVGKMNIVSGL